jgi:hypothetical protein
MVRFSFSASLVTTGLSVSLIGLAGFVASPAQAICLSGTLNTTGNTCSTFNNTGTSTATLLFADPGLNTDEFLQIGFSSQNLGTTPPPIQSSGFSVTNIQYSLDNVTFLPFGTGSASQAISNSGVNSFQALYTPSFQLPAPLPSSGTTLYVRYTLPSTITTDGQLIGVYLRTNTNGNPNVGTTVDSAGTTLLSTAAGDGGTLLTRDNILDLTTPPTPTSAVPGPLPLMGAAAAFGVSRRLRRRISGKA